MISKPRSERAMLYDVWRQMHERCYNRFSKDFKNYGARGIRVERGWLDFDVFFSDMSPRPAGGSLDRIDNDGPYSKDNCRWTSAVEQRRKTRRIVMTPAKIAVIFAMREAGHTYSRIGAETGVGKSHVSQILRGKLWA